MVYDDKIKCVVVGDDWVGKTSMLLGYATNRYPTKHVPPAFDNYAGSLKIGGRKINLNIMDTLQQECCSELRHKSLVDTDIFLVCFSVVQPESLTHVRQHWLPHIKKMAPSIPFILVGTMADLRQADVVLNDLSESGQKVISQQDGEEMAQALGASCYVECSPDVEKNVRRLLNNALTSVIRNNTPSNQCTIL
ncbi:cdc42 homolog [Patella vulgata]|uniref:cdc42 homolog n=1 Tax=Patella vulgata TaxID=6465 RepID=UPI0024A9B780|nr:cdc42 homolog [Patella vulgata]XP_055957882.1 cdc42 homolog [Patella vulgata]